MATPTSDDLVRLLDREERARAAAEQLLLEARADGRHKGHWIALRPVLRRQQ